MNITIKTIEHQDQRYETVGDYQTLQGGTQEITVSRMSDPRYEFLVGLHELIEMRLVQQAGVSEEAITEFDILHGDSDDPGSLPDAPYRRQHEFATAIEMLVAQALGVDWVEYDTEVKSL